MGSFSLKGFVLLITLLTAVTLNSFAGCLLLKDGRFFKGEVVYLSRERLILKDSGDYRGFNCADIELLSCSRGENGEMELTFELEGKVGAELLKITGGYIYFLKDNGTSYSYTHLSNLKSSYAGEEGIAWRKVNEISAFNRRVELEEDLGSFLTFTVYNRVLKNRMIRDSYITEPAEPLKAMDPDFYEKFWLLFSPLLNDEINSIIWDLLEGYSEKERLISKKYGGQQHFTGQARAKYLREVKLFREEFYSRVKRAILLMN